MHYTVAVVTKEHSEQEVEELLAPFDENIEVEPYVCNTKQEIIEQNKKKKAELEEDMKLYAADKPLKHGNWLYWLTDKNVNPRQLRSNYEDILKCKTDEDFYKLYRGDDNDNYNENGDELSTYNPKSKWDWYSVGGRWDGYFLNKKGERTNEDLISEIVWTGSEEEKQKAARFWELVVEDAKLKEGEEKPFIFYKKEYYLQRYHTKEEYVERITKTCPYAVLTPEGEWVAPGEMGWFSSSESDEDQKKYEEWFDKFIAEHQDCYITLVDCHI